MESTENIVWAEQAFGPSLDDSLEMYANLPDDVRNYLDRISDIDFDAAEELLPIVTDQARPIEISVVRRRMVDFLSEHDERVIV